MFSKNATKKVGRTATVRVRRTLCQRFHVRFKNPSIANCPAYVPVIVELWPAAKMPIAQIYLKMMVSFLMKITGMKICGYFFHLQGCWFENASQENATFENISIYGLVVDRKGICMRIVDTYALVMNFPIGFAA